MVGERVERRTDLGSVAVRHDIEIDGRLAGRVRIPDAAIVGDGTGGRVVTCITGRAVASLVVTSLFVTRLFVTRLVVPGLVVAGTVRLVGIGRVRLRRARR